MDKVYIVTVGAYSDYQIEGVFADKEKAAQFCAMNNRGCGYNYEIEEYEFQDNRIECEDKAGYTYRLYNSPIIDQFYKKPLFVSFEKIQFHSDFQRLQEREAASQRQEPVLRVWLEERDDEKAKKILFDMYAEHKAKRAGIF